MTGNSLKSIMVTLFIFAMVLSPILPSAEAGRLNYRGDYLLKRSSLSNSFFVHYQHLISYWSYACVCVCRSPVWTANMSSLCMLLTSTSRVLLPMLFYSYWNWIYNWVSMKLFRSLMIFIYVYCRNKLVYE